MGRRILAMAFVVLMLGAVPASAGTAANPEVTDVCGLSQSTLASERIPPWQDICSVWFSTATESNGGIVVTLETGALQPRTPTFHAVMWQGGGCSLAAVAMDSSNPADKADHALYVQCARSRPAVCGPLDPPGATCWTQDDPIRVPLDGAVVESADTITFTIAPTLLQPSVRALFEPGDILDVPTAFSGPVVGDGGLFAGPCEGFTCPSMIGDWTDSGRSFVIGG